MNDKQLVMLLDLFYRLVKETADVVAIFHADALQCRFGCSECCIDGIRVFPVEAKYIQHHYDNLLRHGKPRAEGACAFLDEQGGCRIYEHRPYICRIMGLPFRWIENPDVGVKVEWRDICGVNSARIDVKALPEEACFTLGSFEARLLDLQKSVFGSTERIALRDLFDAEAT